MSATIDGRSVDPATSEASGPGTEPDADVVDTTAPAVTPTVRGFLRRSRAWIVIAAVLVLGALIVMAIQGGARAPGAPLAAGWQMLGGQVRHGFTHFNLDVALAAATIPAHTDAPEGEWWPVADIAAAGLPTVFAKAARMFGRVHA